MNMDDPLAPCKHCGHHKDTPNHALGCATSTDKSMDELAAEIHATACRSGFWDHEEIVHRDSLLTDNVIRRQNPSLDAEKIALMHSELSEALEALRDDNMDLVAEELADTIIRILDYAHARGLSMDCAVREKMAKNRGRPHLHGRSW